MPGPNPMAATDGQQMNRGGRMTDQDIKTVLDEMLGKAGGCCNMYENTDPMYVAAGCFRQFPCATFAPDLAWAIPAKLLEVPVRKWNAEKEEREQARIMKEGIAKHGSKEKYLAFLEAEKARIEAERIAAEKKRQEEFRASMIATHGSWEKYLEYKAEQDRLAEERRQAELEAIRIQHEKMKAEKAAKEKAEHEYYLAHKKEIDAQREKEKKEKAGKEKAEKKRKDEEKKKEDKRKAEEKAAAYKARRAEDERKRIEKAQKCHNSDLRLKRDITCTGMSESGINIYTFRYCHTGNSAVDAGISDVDTLFSGAMAQDLLAHGHDNAVILDKATGYFKVDYSLIDVDFTAAV